MQPTVVWSAVVGAWRAAVGVVLAKGHRELCKETAIGIESSDRISYHFIGTLPTYFVTKSGAYPSCSVTCFFPFLYCLTAPFLPSPFFCWVVISIASICFRASLSICWSERVANVERSEGNRINKYGAL